jgi:putative membrane protein
MQNIFFRVLIFVVAVFITDWLLVGVAFETVPDAIIVGLLFAFVNTFIKPILKIFTFPLTLMTLGFFPIILNIAIVLIIAQMIPGFRIIGDFFFTGVWALAFSVLLTIVNTILDTFFKIAK